MSRRSSAAEALVLGRSMVGKMTNDPKECRENARLARVRRFEGASRPMRMDPHAPPFNRDFDAGNAASDSGR